MNKKILILLSASLVSLLGWMVFQSRIAPETILTQTSPGQEAEVEEVSGAGKSLDAWSLARSYPSEKIKSNKFTESHEVKQRLLSTNSSNRSDWEPLGPQNFAGRILAITVDPNNPNTLYAGAASGGLWKSIDDGANWNYLSTGMPVLGVSSIVINPDDSNEMYIGTGEVYGDFDPDDMEPNQSTGQGYTIRYRRGTYGIGILKTTDGGLTWNYSLDWSQEEELKGVNCLEISTFDSDVLYAGTTDGLFHSTDGGTTWNNILNLPNVMSLAMHPTDEGTMLVGVGVFGSTGSAVYRTIDGMNFSPVDLPDFTGKATMDFSKSDPNIAFASIGNYDETIGLFRSEDGGINWTMTSDYDYAKYQGWYSHDVAINPTNSSTVLVGGINVYRSTDEGQTLIPESDWLLWNLSAFPVEGPEQLPGDFIHADIHEIIYHPNIPNKIYVASDGGVFKSENDGLAFVSANSGLQTVQFYQKFSSSLSDPDFAIGGLQDNATAVYRGGLAWERKIGGDGFGTVIDPNDDRSVWGSLYYMRLFYSDDKAENFTSNTGVLPGCGGVDPDCYSNFSAPICFAPSSPDQRLYGASNIVYTIENGTTRTATNGGNPLDGNNPVNCLAASPTDHNLVFAGTAPLYTSPAKMFKSENGGDTWTEVTNGLPDRFPMEVMVDPCDNNVIYTVFGGYDLLSHVYKSENGGGSWNTLGEDLPDVPTNTIFIDPENTQHIYVGNDIGVFVSTDGGDTWMTYSTGLPDACMVMSLSYTASTRKLRVATHGNGVYETDLLHEQEMYIAKTDQLAEWYSDDFEVSFDDLPSACVYQNCFYTIKDFDGTEWRGNNLRGFISDDFEQPNLNAEWSTNTGTWGVQNGELLQSNSSSQNTQLNIDLTQDNSSSFMYQWKMKFEGNGTEKRAGVHIFSDDLSQDFRGNSYLIYFYEDQDRIRVIKTNSAGDYDVLLIEDVSLLVGDWLNCKVIYDPVVGRIIVYLDDKRVADVVDINPLQSGNGLSFRTGETNVSFDEVAVYKGRDCSGTESIVVATDGDCRFESQNDSTFVCGIQSIGFSNMRGWSTPDESQVKIGEHLLSLQGSIFTYDDEAVKDIDVVINGGVSSTLITDDLGVFDTEVMSGLSFEIRPEKLDDVKNGVNIFDMSDIQKHILGLELFDSPYQYIAADVNNSGTITVLDILKIRFVILNIDTEFPGTDSWRFVPNDFVFSNPIDLNNFDESISITQISEDRNDAGFVGIKMGDVNSSATLFTSNTPVDTRSSKYVYLLLENKKLTVGEQVEIPFFAKDFKSIAGYQMALDFDDSALEFVEAKSNKKSNFPKEYFGTNDLEKGLLLMNWVSGKAISVDDESELFTLIFKAKKETTLREVLKITDQELQTVACNQQNDQLRIGLEFFAKKENIFSEISFSPNPFSQKTQLNIQSDKEEMTEIIFYDGVGRVLKTEKTNLQKGKNLIEIDFVDSGYSGIIFYQIKSENGRGEGRLVKL
ncbi:MAG: cohesin domain-containing protein [Saprospiraceae bacterium]